MKPARLLCPWDAPSKNTGVGFHFVLQGIFPTQGSNPGLLHCRWILYYLIHQGSPGRSKSSDKPGWESKCLLIPPQTQLWVAKESFSEEEGCWALKGSRILITKSMKHNSAGESHRPKPQSRHPMVAGISAKNCITRSRDKGAQNSAREVTNQRHYLQQIPRRHLRGYLWLKGWESRLEKVFGVGAKNGVSLRPENPHELGTSWGWTVASWPSESEHRLTGS